MSNGHKEDSSTSAISMEVVTNPDGDHKVQVEQEPVKVATDISQNDKLENVKNDVKVASDGVAASASDQSTKSDADNDTKSVAKAGLDSSPVDASDKSSDNKCPVPDGPEKEAIEDKVKTEEVKDVALTSAVISAKDQGKTCFHQIS